MDNGHPSPPIPTSQNLQHLADMVVVHNATGNEDLFIKAVQELIAGVRSLRGVPMDTQTVPELTGETT